MLALRYVYVLALVVWLGGMVVLGAIVAPATFQVLQASDAEGGRALAGAVFGTIIGRFYNVSYGAGVVMLLSLAAMGVLGPRPAHFFVRLVIISITIAVTTYAAFVVLREINQIQSDLGYLPSMLAAADPRRLRFDTLHNLSTRLMQFNLVAGLVLLYWEAREA